MNIWITKKHSKWNKNNFSWFSKDFLFRELQNNSGGKIYRQLTYNATSNFQFIWINWIHRCYILEWNFLVQSLASCESNMVLFLKGNWNCFLFLPVTIKLRKSNWEARRTGVKHECIKWPGQLINPEI